MPHTLFIADCHLSAERADIIQAFKQFLADIAPNADALYILGDLMDVWVGDDDPQAHNIIPSLRALSRKVPIYFMHGNRDFAIGKSFAKKSGLTLLHQPQVINLYDQPTLIMHGDILCTDDHAYQCYRRIIQNPVTQWLLLQTSLKMRLRIAARLRKKSIESNTRKSPEIMDVNQNAVRKYMNRFRVKRLIHGHTHRPAIHNVQTAQGDGKRVVLGDWYQRGSYLSVSGQGMELIKL